MHLCEKPPLLGLIPHIDIYSSNMLDSNDQ